MPLAFLAGPAEEVIEEPPDTAAFASDPMLAVPGEHVAVSWSVYRGRDTAAAGYRILKSSFNRFGGKFGAGGITFAAPAIAHMAAAIAAANGRRISNPRPLTAWHWQRRTVVTAE